MDWALDILLGIPHRICPSLIAVEGNSIVYRREDSRCTLVLAMVVGIETYSHIGNLVDRMCLSCVVGCSETLLGAIHCCLMREEGSYSYDLYSPLLKLDFISAIKEFFVYGVQRSIGWEGASVLYNGSFWYGCPFAITPEMASNTFIYKRYTTLLQVSLGRKWMAMKPRDDSVETLASFWNGLELFSRRSLLPLC